MIAEKLSDNIFLGRKCFFCGSYGLYRLTDKRLKCRTCRAYYSLNKLRRGLKLLYFFYLELSTRKAARELGIGYKSVHKQYMTCRQKIAAYAGREFNKLRAYRRINCLFSRADGVIPQRMERMPPNTQ